ncbi:MAG: hypothetical protein ACOYBW_08560 [Fluviibacter phosphoraccumulans]
MKLRQICWVFPVAVASLALIGCGSGSGSDNGNNAASANGTSTKAEAGQPYIVSTLVNDQKVSASTYKVYSVSDDQGTLSDKPLAQAEEEKLPHVLILQSTSGTAPQAAIARYADSVAVPNLSAAIPLTDVITCYKDLFTTVKALKPALKTRAQIAQRLADFDVTVDEICTQLPTSGLSMTEYVSLFDKITDYWPNVTDIDGKAARFFMNIRVRPITFQQALIDNGYSWDSFLKRISGRTDGLDEFYQLYEESDLAIKPFLAYYMETATQSKLIVQARNHLKLLGALIGDALIPSAMAQTTASCTSSVDNFVDCSNKILNIGGQYWEIAKVAWGVIQNSVGQATIDRNNPQSYIISAKDKSTLNYYGAKESFSDKVSFVGETYAFGLWENYRVDMIAVCDYDAKHPTIPGQWMPNIGIKTPVVNASWGLGKGYKVNGKVVASNPVDRGTPESPIPSIDLTMEMTATAYSTVNKSYVFNCRGDTGASFKY